MSFKDRWETPRKKFVCQCGGGLSFAGIDQDDNPVLMCNECGKVNVGIDGLKEVEL